MLVNFLAFKYDTMILNMQLFINGKVIIHFTFSTIIKFLIMRYMLSCVKKLYGCTMNNWLNIIEIALSINDVLYDWIDSYTLYDNKFL